MLTVSASVNQMILNAKMQQMETNITLKEKKNTELMQESSSENNSTNITIFRVHRYSINCVYSLV